MRRVLIVVCRVVVVNVSRVLVSVVAGVSNGVITSHW
jgi:hypothetical protein